MPIKFLLVGSGWRAEFFIRLARILPEYFAITAIITTSEEKTKQYEGWGFRCAVSIEAGLAIHEHVPEFVVVSVNKDVIHQISLKVLSYGLPVLSETPVAADYAEIVRFFKALPREARYQVAEQYQFRPDHMARMKCIESGRLGEPVQARISLTNHYHAFSLMRKYLGVKGDQAVIRGQRFITLGKPGFEREGVPELLAVRSYRQTVATIQFGSKVGIYNFEEDQHRSFIRSQHIQIKGENGEISNDEVRYLKGREPILSHLLRRNKGENENMEGSGLKGILFEGEWVYKNPLAQGTLSDDETAVAECLLRMHAYCHQGPAFYGFAEAAQDCYLAMLLEKAVAAERVMIAEEQPWTAMLYENAAGAGSE